MGLDIEVKLPIRLQGTNFPITLSYESALGFTSWDWDLIRSDLLEEQLQLLFQNICRVYDSMALGAASQECPLLRADMAAMGTMPTLATSKADAR